MVKSEASVTVFDVVDPMTCESSWLSKCHNPATVVVQAEAQDDMNIVYTCYWHLAAIVRAQLKLVRESQ